MKVIQYSVIEMNNMYLTLSKHFIHHCIFFLRVSINTINKYHNT